MKKILILLFILISQNSFSQKLKVYGIVSDEEATLSGVSVVIKGTKIGVDTDKNSYFEIEVNKLFSGLSVVTELKSEMILCLCPGVVGFSFLNPISKYLKC